MKREGGRKEGREGGGRERTDSGGRNILLCIHAYLTEVSSLVRG